MDQETKPQEAEIVQEPTQVTAQPTIPSENQINVEVEGYSFVFDKDLLDDVEVIKQVALIEKGRADEILNFMVKLLGQDGFDQMEQYFKNRDGRFKLSTLMKIFETSFRKFDPKA